MARGICRYRDIFYLVCICALGLFTLNANIDCASEFKGKFGKHLIEGRFLREDEQILSQRNLALAGQVSALKMRVEALEKENKWLNIEKETRLQTEVEMMKLRSRLGKTLYAKLESDSLDREAVSKLEERKQEVIFDAISDVAPTTLKETGSGSAPNDGVPHEEGGGDTQDEEENQQPEADTATEVAGEAPARNDPREEGDDTVAEAGGQPEIHIVNKTEDMSSSANIETHKEVLQVNFSDTPAPVLDDETINSPLVTSPPGEDEPPIAVEEEENTVDEEEDEGDDEEDEEPVPTSPKAFGYKDLGNQTFKLLNQVSPNSKKHFKAVGTKFISLFRAWEHNGWKHRYDSSSAGVSLYLTKPITRIPGGVLSGKMISQISKSSCIGGSKGAQLRCKVNLCEKHQCDFQSLNISPAQFNLYAREDCEKFIKIATLPKNAKKMWILKDGGAYHGKRMKVYEGLKSDVKKRFGKCSKDKKGAGYIMMEYVSNPLLFESRKFDIRTYMLIASTKPFMVFYHKGFIRRSGMAYSNSSFSKLGHITNHKSQDKQSGHFWGFESLSTYLAKEEGFPDNYMDTEFRNYVKHATNFIFQAARHKLKRRSGSFMLFGLDWMVDRSRKIHFLEANGNPTIQNYEGTGLGPKVWQDMTALLTSLHREPESFQTSPTVKAGFKSGGWELIFNEAEEIVNGQSYNPCMFKEYLKCKTEMCNMW